MQLTNPQSPFNMTQVTDWYDQGKLSVEEAIKWQQYFCKHTNFISEPSGMPACLDCGIKRALCASCGEHLVRASAKCNTEVIDHDK
jgi:hypothetical protein